MDVEVFRAEVGGLKDEMRTKSVFVEGCDSVR